MLVEVLGSTKGMRSKVLGSQCRERAKTLLYTRANPKHVVQHRYHFAT